MTKPFKDIFKMSQSTKVILPPIKPYVLINGNLDIPFTTQNATLIGMTYIHEGVMMSLVGAAEYDVAEKAAGAPGATGEAIENFEIMKTKNFITTIISEMANWYLILVACYQVRDLTQSNLDNYAKMCKSPPFSVKALKYISYWAATQDNFVSNVVLREKFMGNKFFEYHTTGSSTPMLCAQAIDEVSELGIFDSDEIHVVTEAVSKIHDIGLAREIDPFILVKTRAVLEASGTLPETWYMGEKALEKYSRKKYSAVVKYLKAIFIIQTKVDDIADMNMVTLVRNLKELLISSPNVARAIGSSDEIRSGHDGDEGTRQDDEYEDESDQLGEKGSSSDHDPGESLSDELDEKEVVKEEVVEEVDIKSDMPSMPVKSYKLGSARSAKSPKKR